jgi:dihydroorotase-like cyclic amidohydrolase
MLKALWEGLSEGTISFVVTDHAGCNPEEEKSSNNFWEVYGGIPGIEHTRSVSFQRRIFEKTANPRKKLLTFFQRTQQNISI